MVWDYYGMENLHIIKQNMNKTMYLDISRNHLKQSAGKMNSLHKFMLYE